ncbi:phosphoribosylanthranilate isomerase [Tunicatimonas pelagia]|uniref:phosphoribosylanthranilate isomerase n=1 Tax=Tunicatimonas pelagia TaxID=931531 RepID=UPI00266630A3|nr:phosphoribosylanthranilate isomerase [Tunicatimonas pelagia]WKN41180.1 phosphoribosylanthranilate isomerase [Tunicatimonas pelagia]
MKLKICGMKYAKNLREVATLQPDYLGFIFYEKSPRYMADCLAPEEVKAIPDRIQKIGVFVNAINEYILQQAQHFGLNGVQLHGDESPVQCRELKAANYTVIKVFRLGSVNFDFTQLASYEAHVDYFLFDTQTPNYGGSGHTFDWSQLEEYTLTTPFFLSGGIGLDNLEEALSLNHDQFIGLDVNSRFEIEPGHKDSTRLKKLVNKVRNPHSEE